MATSVWKGHLTFGLVSIPVKLYRASRAEKVGFRQVHEATGTRVRQTLFREPEPSMSARARNRASSDSDGGLTTGISRTTQTLPATIPFPASVQVSRDELAKGYEYEPGRYLVLSREELEQITPRTAYEMQILEFVKLAEVDPVYFETSYYVAPDRAGERACALLFEALRASGFVALAQVAMHRREHVVVIRPGRTGIILHTMFYETEIRREDEHRTDAAKISEKELELALMLVRNLAAPFDPSKYRDSYREKLDTLIAAKLQGLPLSARDTPHRAPVGNILDALQRSLQSTESKPKMSEAAQAKRSRGRSRAPARTSTRLSDVTSSK